MKTRRGKYWESDPRRLEKAEAKRERRRARNMKQALREHWYIMFPGYDRKNVV
jgi:hypothetical protein